MPPTRTGLTMESEAPASGKLLLMTSIALDRAQGAKTCNGQNKTEPAAKHLAVLMMRQTNT